MTSGAVDPIEDDTPELEMSGPERRCLVTGAILPKEKLLRFGVAPDGALVPDVAERLPGRGLWVSADRETLQAAFRKNPFSRAARRAVKVPADGMEQVITLMRQRLIDRIGFARRAGFAVSGFEKVETLARKKRIEAIIVGCDSGKDGRRKLDALAPNAHIIDVLDSRTLAGIFGTIGIVVYAGISDKTHAAGLALLADRLKALMPPVLQTE